MVKDSNGPFYALRDSAPVQMFILLTLYASQIVGVLPSITLLKCGLLLSNIISIFTRAHKSEVRVK